MSSETYSENGKEPRYGNDGIHCSTVFQTDRGDSYSWWRVDLLSTYFVVKVHIKHIDRIASKCFP